MTDIRYDAADLAGVQQYMAQNSNPVFMRQDASIFAARQLAYVKARVFEKLLPPMKGLQLVPITTDVPEWAETIIYRAFDEFGIAKIISNYADDLPRANVLGREYVVRVKDIGGSYGYNLNELAASVATGTNLPDRKATAVRKAIEIKLNQIAMIGDPEYGLYGLLTHPNVGTVTITGGWGTAQANAILDDLDAIYNAIRVQSNGVHTPNVMAMPVEQYSRITSRLLPDSNGLTVAQFFLNKHPGLRFEEVPEFAGAGAGGADVVMAFEQNADNFNLDLVKAFDQLAAQARNLELVVNCLARTAGVEVHYPLALVKAEGI